MGAPNQCGGRQTSAGLPKSPNIFTSTFFNTVNFLPNDLRFRLGGAKLVSCPGHRLTSLRPWLPSRRLPIPGLTESIAILLLPFLVASTKTLCTVHTLSVSDSNIFSSLFPWYFNVASLMSIPQQTINAVTDIFSSY